MWPSDTPSIVSVIKKIYLLFNYKGTPDGLTEDDGNKIGVIFGNNLGFYSKITTWVEDVDRIIFV